MVTVFIGVGSNLGNRSDNIKKALRYLEESDDILIEEASSVIETDPVGIVPQPKYLNGVVKINTGLSPRDLLSVLQGIENKLGRRRILKFGPRTIDLDILLYGNEIIDYPDLKVPHPRMFERDFVLRSLFEIEPQIVEIIKSLKFKARIQTR